MGISVFFFFGSLWFS